jgi:hypothetical protein
MAASRGWQAGVVESLDFGIVSGESAANRLCLANFPIVTGDKTRQTWGVERYRWRFGLDRACKEQLRLLPVLEASKLNDFRGG